MHIDFILLKLNQTASAPRKNALSALWGGNIVW